MMMEKAEIVKQRKVSSIWIIPIVALLLGAWMLIDGFFRADPVVEIQFETADGIEAGRTKVKTRNIEIGIVESVRLSEDYSDIIASVRIDRESADLLKSDSLFWVARPRIGIGGISGVGTLLSGAFIVLEPGTSGSTGRNFVGLESPPSTPATAEGLRLSVYSETSGSVNQGDPVLFRGRRVGQIDGAEFEVEQKRFRYDLFVKAPFDDLVTTMTRFWKASAIALQADANGFSLNADSLEAMLSGGIAFDLPEGRTDGDSVADGVSFRLFDTKADIDKFPHRHFAEYLLFFQDSVRGLKSGAPVEYRGIQIGEVVDVSFSYLRGRTFFGDEEIPVPALIRIYPGHLEMEDSPAGLENLRELVSTHLVSGLRATLRRGNLLTGNLFVSLDFFAQAEEVSQLDGWEWGYDVLPTQMIGLEQIERRIVDVLDMVEQLPLEKLSNEVREAIAHARSMFDKSSGLVESLDTIFGSEETKSLPSEIQSTLKAMEAAMQGVSPNSELYREIAASMKQLDATLMDLQKLSQKLERRPNSLLFSKPAKRDPEPKKSK